jgi:hypothetical protein
MAGTATSVEELPDLLPEKMQCPLCGEGEISRAEVLDRLGMRDFIRIAELTASQALQLLLKQEKQSENTRWQNFEVELTKRLADVTQRHQAELQKLQSEKNEISARLRQFEKNSATVLSNAKEQERLTTEKQLQEQLTKLNGRIAELEATQKLAEQQKATEVNRVKAELQAALNIEKATSTDLDRRVKNFNEELSKLKDRNQQLEAEMAKVVRVGKAEEKNFGDYVSSIPGIWIEAVTRNGDHLLAYRDAAGNPLEPKMVVDCKDKITVAETDIKKLIRDCKYRNLPVGIIVAREASQLRNADRDCRWGEEDGVWLLRSTRGWLHRDLELLKPILQRMGEEGPEFLSKNAVLASEVQKTFAELDEIEKELAKAGKAIDRAKAATANYHTRLAGLCETASTGRKQPKGSGEELTEENLGAGD